MPGTETPGSEPLTAAAVAGALVQVATAAEPLDLGDGSLSAFSLGLAGQQVACVCFDHAVQHGSIGVQEAGQLVRAIGHARASRGPLVLLLETSGIRVTDGTAGIASLRRVLHEAGAARLEGVRMLAVVLRYAFGGASMLAALCELRLVHPGSLYAMSGPRLVTQTAGMSRFDAGRADDVRALMGGVARAAVADRFRLVGSSVDAFRDAVLGWLDAPPPGPIDASGLRAEGAALGQRLRQAGLPQAAPHAHANPAIQRILETIFAGNFEWRHVQGMDVACSDARPQVRAFVLAAGDGVGASQAWALATALLDCAGKAGRRRMTHVLFDSPGHAATPEDEQVVLSDYLVYLFLVMRWLHANGEPVELVVAGVGGGGIQAALGGGASFVSMAEGARLLVLPPVALSALNKAQDEGEGHLDEAIRVGAVDALFPAGTGQADDTRRKFL